MKKILTREEFDVLDFFAEDQAKADVKTVADAIGMDMVCVQETIQQLEEKGYIKDEELTPDGLGALEP